MPYCLRAAYYCLTDTPYPKNIINHIYNRIELSFHQQPYNTYLLNLNIVDTYTEQKNITRLHFDIPLGFDVYFIFQIHQPYS